MKRFTLRDLLGSGAKMSLLGAVLFFVGSCGSEIYSSSADAAVVDERRAQLE